MGERYPLASLEVTMSVWWAMVMIQRQGSYTNLKVAATNNAKLNLPFGVILAKFWATFGIYKISIGMTVIQL